MSAPEHAQPVSEPQAASPNRLNPADEVMFRARIIELTRQHKPLAQAIVAGNVQMLGFEQLKSRLGPMWQKVRDRVHGLAEAIIQKHLGPGDLYLKADDERMIVLFDRLPRPEAEAKARSIATSSTSSSAPTRSTGI
jgi:hypothetical protein